MRSLILPLAALAACTPSPRAADSTAAAHDVATVVDSGMAALTRWHREPPSAPTPDDVTLAVLETSTDSRPPAYLAARCLNGQTELAFADGAPFVADTVRPVVLRLASEGDVTTDTSTWRVVHGAKAFLFAPDAQALLPRLAAARRVEIAYPSDGAVPRVHTFSLERLADLLPQLQAACHWQ